MAPKENAMMQTNEEKLKQIERRVNEVRWMRNAWERLARATRGELGQVKNILNELDAELANARDKILDLEKQFELYRGPWS